METEELNAVTAAILADAAFDSVGDAIKLSTPLYREMFENIRRSGELPPAWRTASISSEPSHYSGKSHAVQEPRRCGALVDYTS